MSYKKTMHSQQFIHPLKYVFSLFLFSLLTSFLLESATNIEKEKSIHFAFLPKWLWFNNDNESSETSLLTASQNKENAPFNPASQKQFQQFLQTTKSNTFKNLQSNLNKKNYKIQNYENSINNISLEINEINHLLETQKEVIEYLAKELETQINDNIKLKKELKKQSKVISYIVSDHE